MSTFAPGKIILFGEHSVVYGEPAVAASIDRGIRVTLVEPGRGLRGDSRLDRALGIAANRFSLDPEAIGVQVESDLREGCGLGSSAALSVSLVRACAERAGVALDARKTARAAWELEDVYHGTSSGLDVSASAFGGLVRFERGDPPRIERIHAPAGVDLVVALSEASERRTSGPVSSLRLRWEASPDLYDSLFQTAGRVAAEGVRSLQAGDWAAVGELMNVAQGLLGSFGVSTAELEETAEIARKAGALGAKLTGAGGGGAVIAIAPSGAREVVRELERAGREAFVVRIGRATSRGDEKTEEEGEDAHRRFASG